MSVLPPSLCASPWRSQLEVAVLAVTAVGPALLALRGTTAGREVEAGQLKAPVDRAAEGFVAGLIRASFPGDALLAEEEYEDSGAWSGNQPVFWTVDALDGTRSFVDGYDGFCSQVAFIVHGHPVVAAVGEPVSGRCYVAVAGCGAFRLEPDGRSTRLQVSVGGSVPPRYVDSVPPGGSLGELLQRRRATFVECGSIGLKICRIAEGAVDVFVKAFRHKLWDIAPGQLILEEAGGRLTDWTGRGADFLSPNVHRDQLLAAASEALPPWVDALTKAAS